eukprot:1520859-Karenia_brevis.AAC.1
MVWPKKSTSIFICVPIQHVAQCAGGPNLRYNEQRVAPLDVQRIIFLERWKSGAVRHTLSTAALLETFLFGK